MQSYHIISYDITNQKTKFVDKTHLIGMVFLRIVWVRQQPDKETHVRKIALILSILAFSSAAVFARGSGGGHSGSHVSSGGSHSVSGYTKRDGTHVAPHHATNPNNTKRDNWSSKPNVNPYTGKEGTKDPNR